MQYRLDVTAELSGLNNVQKILLVDVFSDFTIDEVLEFVRFREIVDGDKISGDADTGTFGSFPFSGSRA